MTQSRGDAIARRLWNAIAQADVEQLRKLIAPKAVWRMYGQGPLAGTHVGIDAILDFMAKVGDLSDVLESNLIDVFTGETGVVLRYSIHARRGDRVLDIEHLFMIQVLDGVIIEGVFAPLDQER
jgi:ketosteroid isomerase-like protein